MVAELFESLLVELAKSLDIKELKPDPHNSCLIHFQNGVEIQIEPYEKDEQLLLVIDLGSIPPGHYREDVFKESLVANGMPYPRHGFFAYSDQSDHLLLMDFLPLKDLNGEKIASAIYPLIEKAKVWQDNLSRGAVPIAETTSQGRRAPGLFGL